MALEQDSAKHWYAFKVFFNKVFEIDKELKRLGGETYFPIVRSYKIEENKKKQVIKPAISSLIFVRCPVDDVMTYQNQLNGRVMLYTHVTDGVRKPSPIDEEEMRIFKLVTSVEDVRLQYWMWSPSTTRKDRKCECWTDPTRAARVTLNASKATAVCWWLSKGWPWWPPPTSPPCFWRKSEKIMDLKKI